MKSGVAYPTIYFSISKGNNLNLERTKSRDGYATVDEYRSSQDKLLFNCHYNSVFKSCVNSQH